MKNLEAHLEKHVQVPETQITVIPSAEAAWRGETRINFVSEFFAIISGSHAENEWWLFLFHKYNHYLLLSSNF
jgi:hypothetical protein